MKLLLIQFAATWFLTGLICFVHVVHYPLFDGVGTEAFQDWHSRHVNRTGFVVILPMLIELATAIAFALAPPPGMRSLAFVGLALVAVAWAATFFFAVPAHDQLAKGFDAVAHQRLLRADLIRALAWSARAILLGWIVYRLIEPPAATS